MRIHTCVLQKIVLEEVKLKNSKPNPLINCILVTYVRWNITYQWRYDSKEEFACLLRVFCCEESSFYIFYNLLFNWTHLFVCGYMYQVPLWCQNAWWRPVCMLCLVLTYLSVMRLETTSLSSAGEAPDIAGVPTRMERRFQEPNPVQKLTANVRTHMSYSHSWRYHKMEKDCHQHWFARIIATYTVHS